MIRINRILLLMFSFIIILYLNRDLLNRIVKEKELNINYKLKDRVIKFMFQVYISILIAVVYFPIDISWGENKIYKVPKIYLAPIQTVIRMYENKGIIHVIKNIGGNLILLAPLAFFMCHYFKDIFYKKGNIIILTIFISLFIECSQVTLSVIIPSFGRVFDINDLICNTIGGVIGYKFYKIISLDK